MTETNRRSIHARGWRKTLIALAGSSSLLALVAPAVQAAELEEIVVTASKRSQSLQDVSASVSALTGADIMRQGMDGFESFARVLPGITLNQQVKNRSMFNIRGIATSTFPDNTQDPVSVYINETPVTDTFGAIVQPDLRLFDVERIEVLRGPQGTLFGSGSLGGTVRIITRQPDANLVEAAGRVDLGLTKGNALRQRYDAMVNVPLVDEKLALRVVGYYRDEEGWVENLTLGTRNDTVDWGGRIAMRWTPNTDLSAKLEVIHQDSDPEDGDAWNPTLGKFQRTSTIAEKRPSELTNYSLTLEYDIEDFASVVSATSYQESKSSVFADLGDILGLGLPVYNRSSPWNSEFVTQEIRLVSNTETDFEWLVGAFFIDRETLANYAIEANGLNDFFGGLPGTDNIFTASITTKSQELAGFGDVGYRFADGWKVSGGLRVFRTKVGYSEPDRQVLNFADFSMMTSSLNNTGKDSDMTWRAGLSYDPTEDAMIYANVSRGYRIGQVNPNKGPSLIDPTDVVIPESYLPDVSMNYELGLKSMWFDGGLIINLAAFLIEWKDIQIGAARISDRLSFIANAGKAESKGIELEVQSRPVKGLDLNLAVTVQDAKITRVPTDVLVGARKGDTLPGSVDFQIAGGAQYTWDAFTDKQMYARVDAQYVGSSPNEFTGGADPADVNPFFANNESYENINAAIGLVDARWELTVYGENLTNNASHILTNGGATPNYVNSPRPRTVGARISVRY